MLFILYSLVRSCMLWSVGCDVSCDLFSENNSRILCVLYINNCTNGIMIFLREFGKKTLIGFLQCGLLFVFPCCWSIVLSIVLDYFFFLDAHTLIFRFWGLGQRSGVVHSVKIYYNNILLRAIGSNDDLCIYFFHLYLHCVVTIDANGSGRARRG